MLPVKLQPARILGHTRKNRSHKHSIGLNGAKETVGWLRTHNMLRLFRSPIRGEIEPVRPPLNDKSLEYESRLIFCLYMCWSLRKRVCFTHKDVSAVRPPMSPTS